jgi:hypothetical protein
VELGHDDKYPMTRLGSISFCMLAKEVLELREVLYVPSMTKNLLLVSCLIELKGRANFEDQKVIIKTSRVLARGVREGNLYRQLAGLVKQRALLTSSDNLRKLWHKRFGHLNYGSLPLLKGMVVIFPNFKVVKKECARDVHSTSNPRRAQNKRDS